MFKIGDTVKITKFADDEFISKPHQALYNTYQIIDIPDESLFDYMYPYVYGLDIDCSYIGDASKLHYFSEEELLPVDDLGLLLLNGCTCESCSTKTKTALQYARRKWVDGYREIKILHIETYDVPTVEVIVNGMTVSCNGEDAESVLEGLLDFLSIDNVNIETEYEDYEY